MRPAYRIETSRTADFIPPAMRSGNTSPYVSGWRTQRIDDAINIPSAYRQFPNENLAVNESSLSKALSQEARPTENVTSILPQQVGPTAVPADSVVAIVVHVLVVSEANKWFASAKTSVNAGDLRKAYRGVYRGLDMLLRNAKWLQVGEALDEIASEVYPADFGIGAMRFVSDAADRIPEWNRILRKLTQAARGQGIDTRTAMRGLVENNGAA